MRLLKRVDDPNLRLRDKVERRIRHISALSELSKGVHIETFDSLQSRIEEGAIRLDDPDAVGDGNVIYTNHASAMIHWHFPERGSSDWMEVTDACLTYTLLRGTVRAYHLEGMIELHPGQSVRMPMGVKFRFEWDTETFAQVFYQRQGACPCQGDCHIVRTGPDMEMQHRES